MSSTDGSTPGAPRPEWRAMLAAISALFLILCLCVMVTAARGRGGGLAGALLRGFADVPLLGRLLEPLLGWTPTPDAPVLDFALPSVAEPATPTPAADYLVRPTNWPPGWAWPPKPLTQPAAVPQVQFTAEPGIQPPPAPAVQPAPVPTSTPSEEEQRKLLEQSDQGPSG